MSCCDIGLLTDAARLRADDLSQWVHEPEQGIEEIEFVLPGLDLPNMMLKIEAAMMGISGVRFARVNLTARRLIVRWNKGAICGRDIFAQLAALGLQAQPFDAQRAGMLADQDQIKYLLRALAVAGFATMNIMLLSVSVWSGAEAATRDLFHWISALIALPSIAYAGRPFFQGALAGLSQAKLNMDVPISIGVILASMMSLYETIIGGDQAYFDASVSLLFFLLAGRTLDYLMRARARSAVSQLMSLAATGALVVPQQGEAHYVAAFALKPGMRLQVAAGERLAADGIVRQGRSDIDFSLVTGETMPVAVEAGSLVQAGTLNLTGSLIVEVTAAGEDSFLSEVVRMMVAAEQSKSRYVQLAERLSGYYAPVVHLLSAFSIAGWLIYSHGDWHVSLMVGIAVLIITCPCALGLAVPAVQVVASGALFRNGVMIKDGAGLEKLSHIDTVIFDKTGTLTLNEFSLVEPRFLSNDILALAAGIAANSRHPLAQALLSHAKRLGVAGLNITDVREYPGEGLSTLWQGNMVKLGSRSWCGVAPSQTDVLPEIVLQHGALAPIIFRFQDNLRPDVAAVIAGLKNLKLRVEILSGDREAAVRRVAMALGVDSYHAQVNPQMKLAYVEGLAKAGRKILMVGDGLNDAPALAAGFASMAPASASDIGRTAADIVFMGDSLSPVLLALHAARISQRLCVQNFSLAIGYNMLAVPVAILGFASPLIAAVAMSSSSILVVCNALRFNLLLREKVCVKPKVIFSDARKIEASDSMEPAA